MRIWPVAHPVSTAAVASVLSCALASACAPPDPFVTVDTGAANVEPSLAFVNPPPGATFEAELDDDCFLRVLIAADVDNFTLFEPESRPPADNEGHMHVAWGTGGYNPVSESAFLLEVDAVGENLTVGVIRDFRLSLQANDHSDLDQFDAWEATVEYTISDPSGSCF